MSRSGSHFLSEFINQGRYAEAASAAHDAWREAKEGEGWTYGRRRSEKERQHPLLRPFGKLTEQQRIGNNLSAYSTTNFFRTRFKDASLSDLTKVFEDVLAGRRGDLMDELGEYVHSHFTASRIARFEIVDEYPDMVVYEDLDADMQALDLVIARATIRYLLGVIEGELG